jgi:U4/U6.U5 tri-snRNP-associated protein 1
MSRRDRRDEEASDSKRRRTDKGSTGAAPASDPGIIKAVVSESNGEISCSVEETNRIRALLGLKPLRIDKPNAEAQAVKNFNDQKEADTKAKEAAVISERLEKAKEKRLLREKLDGPTLGDDEEGALGSAADWVKRSRVKALDEKEKAKQLAAKMAQEEEEQMLLAKQKNYDASEMKGMQIMHSGTDFEIGDQVVLTLADSSILEKDEYGKVKGVNEDTDVLENVNMTEKDKRLEREKQQKRLKRPVYTAYDDDEFNETGQKPNILSQYDAPKKSGPKLVLGEAGEATTVGKSSVKFEDDEDGDAASGNTKPKSVLQSLKMELGESKDYYTQSEYASFKPKEKKMRKIRKKSSSSEPVKSAGSAAMLEDSIYEAEKDNEVDVFAKRSSDHASRAKRDKANVLSTESSEDAERRRRGYDAAMKTAAGKLKARTATLAGSKVEPAAKAFDDDDADIARSLAEARRLALARTSATDSIQMSVDDDKASATKIKSEPGSGDGVDEGDDDDEAARLTREYMDKATKVKQSLLAQTDNNTTVLSTHIKTEPSAGSAHEVMHANGDSDELAFDEIDAEGRRADGSLVFTSTTEFTTRLQARLNEKARSRAEAAVKSALEPRPSSSKASTGSKGDQKADMNVLMENIASMNEEEMDAIDAQLDDDDDDGDMDVEHTGGNEGDEDADIGFSKEAAVGKGMSSALALLKASGELQKSSELAGRAKDHRDYDPSSHEFGVKLEYRDEFGRKLTQKEAFRQLCYKFHGYGPGKKAKEKRLKQKEMANKAATSRLEGGTMQSLVRAQEATGKAHLTVQGGASGGPSAAELLALRNRNKAKG